MNYFDYEVLSEKSLFMYSNIKDRFEIRKSFVQYYTVNPL